MPDNKESYWSKHHWSIVQCVVGAYCASFATWEHFHRTAPATIQSSAATAGGAMTTGYVMPFWLWIGIVGLALSVAIPAIIRLFQNRKIRNLENERRLLEESHRDELRRLELTHNHELENSREAYRQCKEEKRALEDTQKIQSNEVQESDPRIYVSLKEPGEVPEHPLESRLVLLNQGGSPAHAVEVSELHLRAGNITFDESIGVIGIKESVDLRPKCSNLGPIFSRDILLALKNEFGTYSDQLSREKITIPISVRYADFRGVQFETTCDLVFNGIAHALKSIGVDHRIVDFHNAKFRKVL